MPFLTHNAAGNTFPKPQPYIPKYFFRLLSGSIYEVCGRIREASGSILEASWNYLRDMTLMISLATWNNL
jgi:hypothetical protein